MSNQNKHIDDILRESVQGSGSSYPIPSWDGIEEGLLKAERKKKLVLWWWSAASIVIIGLLGTLWIFQQESSKQRTDGERTNTEQVTKIELNATQPSDDMSDLGLIEDNQNHMQEMFVEQSPTQNTEVVVTSQNKYDREKSVVENDDVSGDIEVKIIEEQIITDSEVAINHIPLPEVVGGELDSSKNENAVDINEDVIYSSKMPNDEPGSQKFRGFWELGLSASPGLASNFVGVNNENKWLINKKYFDVTQNEKSSFAYQIDFHLNRYLSDKIYLGSGLRFVERGEHVDYNYRRDSGVVIRENIKQLDYFPLAAPLIQDIRHEGDNKMQFIEIPLRFGWMQPMSDKLRMKSEFSLNYSYLLKANGKKVNGTELFLEDLSSFADNRHGYGFACQTGLLFGLGDRSELSGNVHYSMNLTSWRAKSSGLIERPYNYGLTIGWNYKLGTTK